MVKLSSLSIPSLKAQISLSKARFAASLEVLRHTIQNLTKEGKLAKELKEYQALAAQMPQDVRTRLKLAELYFRKKDIAAATAQYRDIAEIYYTEQFTMKAIEAYHNVLRLCPTDVAVNERLAHLYADSSMVQDALQQYEIAFYGYRGQGNSAKALEMCEAMIRLSPTPRYRRKLGEIYQAMGRTEDAVREYEAIAAEYRQEKNYSALLEVYKLLLPHREDKHSLIRDMAILYLHKKQPQEAIRLMDRAGLGDDEDCQEIYDRARNMLVHA